eukprot:TRINITY_DN170_c0_g1_i4.p1 TRINITY_DN170_c0_g1~~TRINITY_DN170_c0_g1_i4.p1  ORF type:complete len:318 (-),score=35.71 TRINITY_DN170_c0_g1_i4:167-1120(-)
MSLLQFGSCNSRLVCARAQAITDVSKKHVVITGGNTGIGLETAKVLAMKGYSTTLACRNLDKAKAAQRKIIDEVPNAEIDVLELKLDNLQSVQDAASKLLDSQKQIDVLLNNAGVMACPEMKTDDGFEYQLGVNHLGHFLFTNKLLPKIQENTNGCRIINVASSAHLFGEMDFNDLMFSKKRYDPWRAYGQSKLANILFTYELSRMLQGKAIRCTANCLHPGVVGTELARYIFPTSTPFYDVVNNITKLFVKTPEQGAETSIYLATSPQVQGVSSKYYVDSKPAASSFASYDTKMAKQLWEVSQELTKCDVLISAEV